MIARRAEQMFDCRAISPKRVQHTWDKGKRIDRVNDLLPGYIFLYSESKLTDISALRTLDGYIRCLKGSTRVSQYNSTKSATFIKAPTGIGGSSPKAGQAKITWNAIYGVKSYTVKRRTATTSFVTVKTGITTGSYVDSVPSPGNYIYIVVAVAEDGTNSAYSAEKVISVN